jgi:RNase P subunit RPR2
MGRIGKRPTPFKKYICKHCKVQVISGTNTRAILGREHGKHCPRRNKV